MLKARGEGPLGALVQGEGGGEVGTGYSGGTRGAVGRPGIAIVTWCGQRTVKYSYLYSSLDFSNIHIYTMYTVLSIPAPHII